MGTEAEVDPKGPTIIVRRAIDDPGRCCCNRDFEWYAALNMVYMAFALYVTPKTIEVGAFRYMLKIVMDPGWLWLVFLAVGMVRTGALLLNGRIPFYGPHLRAVGCVLGAIVWSFMFTSLIRLTDDTSTLSIGIGAWGLACVFELKALHRALNDVGNTGEA